MRDFLCSLVEAATFDLSGHQQISDSSRLFRLIERQLAALHNLLIVHINRNLIVAFASPRFHCARCEGDDLLLSGQQLHGHYGTLTTCIVLGSTWIDAACVGSLLMSL